MVGVDLTFLRAGEDLDHNSTGDTLVVDNFDAAVCFLPHRTTGGFGERQNVATVSGPVADVDGDARADWIAVGNHGNGAGHRNIGRSPRFSSRPPCTLFAAGIRPTAVAKPAVARSSETSGPRRTKSPTRPVAIEAAFLDGDSFVDLVVADARAAELGIVLGDGVGGFTAVRALKIGAGPSGLAVGTAMATGSRTSPSQSPGRTRLSFWPAVVAARSGPPRACSSLSPRLPSLRPISMATGASISRRAIPATASP